MLVLLQSHRKIMPEAYARIAGRLSQGNDEEPGLVSYATTSLAGTCFAAIPRIRRSSTLVILLVQHFTKRQTDGILI